MKLRYIGETFYKPLGLTDGKVYEIIDEDSAYYRVIDDSGEDYLYSKNNPRPLDCSSKGSHCGKK